MNLHPETEWDDEDEAYLQDALTRRSIWRQESNARKDFTHARNGRNGEHIQLIVMHPFQFDDWIIAGPAPEPGFYFCQCNSRYRCNGIKYWDKFEQVFHESDFITIMS